jgi:serine phosphatase RsbU (regulator of sigma subunit)
VSAALPGLVWDKETVEFAAGTKLLFYTDGITDVFGGDEYFGPERIEEEVLRTRGGGPPLLDGLTEALRLHAGGRPRSDDWTLLTAGAR